MLKLHTYVTFHHKEVRMRSFSSQNEQHSDNTYLIDPESGAEMARLLDLDQLTTEAMGGLLPPGIVFKPGACVLDVACGPGGWVQQLAFAQPHIEVIGIDISQHMIEYAQAYAEVQGLDNTDFCVMDASKPLKFLDHAFNMVNMRFALAFMLPENWPGFLREVVRISKPGAIIRLTESEGFGFTSSPALAQLNTFTLQAMHRIGRTYHPLGYATNITPMLRHFLQRAGCQQIETNSCSIDFSAGTRGHILTLQNITVALQLMKPFLIQIGVTSSEEFERLLYQAEIETYAEDFSGVCYGFSAWAKTPVS
jgi:ubiquinone/menaquinone biosynthesis C-methylase UbiE